mgnify:CR=1 FL=1
MANFTLTAGADLWQPGVARDVLTGSFANLSSADVIDLGDGLEEDVFVLTSAGVFDTRAGGNASNITGYERLNLAAGSSTVILTHALVMAAYLGTSRAGQFAVLGNGGSDTIDASLVGATGRITLVAGSGNDTFLGGAGNDLVRFNAIELTASDSINAGAGFDTLRVDTAGALAADALVNVRRIETIELSTGGSSVTIAQAMAASADGGVLAVVARGGANVVDASAATTAVNYFAGVGADSYVGGTGVDRVHVTPSTLTSADSFQGGAGAAIDMIRITAPGTFAANAFDGVRGFERIQMSAGGNAITLNDLVFTGVVSTPYVVGEGGNDNVNAGAMTRAITFDPGAGDDRFLGGSGNDFLVIDPVLLVGRVILPNGTLSPGDVFNGGAGRDRVVLKAAGAVNPNAIETLAGFEEIALAPGGNRLPAFGGNAAYAVLGGAGTDDVTLSRASDTASLGGGDDILRIEVGSPGLVADGGTGTDQIVMFGPPSVIGAGITGFERVFVENIEVTFAGPAQNWTVDGGANADTVNTGAGTYDLRLAAGNDTYRVNGGLFISITESGTGGDALVVDSATSFVSADLGAGGDLYTVLAGGTVVIADGGGDDALAAGVTSIGTRLLAQLGAGNDVANLVPRAGWLIDLGEGNDRADLRVSDGDPAGTMLVRGGAGTDQINLVGPTNWGAVVIDSTASDQLAGADGGAVQFEFESFNLSGASSAIATLGATESIVMTPGNDDLTLLAVTNGAVDGGAGIDTLRLVATRGTDINLAGAVNFEILVASEGKDSIVGDARSNTILGGGGDDVIRFGEGGDTVTGGAGEDTFLYRGVGDAPSTITDFDPSTIGANDTLVFDFSLLPLAAGDGSSVTLDTGGPFFPGGTGVLLVTSALGNAAAVDALLASRVFAPNGGVIVGAPTAVGGSIAFWYDPVANATGGANAPTLLVTLTGVASMLLLQNDVSLF